MQFQVTIRHGRRRKGYHLMTVEADDLAEALRLASEEMPADVAEEADLAEVRPAVDPGARPGPATAG